MRLKRWLQERGDKEKGRACEERIALIVMTWTTAFEA
jgi:hypothetical protein